VGHVADGVDVHHQRDEGHHQHHQHGQLVDQEADFELEAAGFHPGVDGAVEGVAGLHVLEDDAPTGRRRGRRRAMVTTCAPARPRMLAEEAGEDGAEQGRQRNE
jgi:hypothetical protein